MAVGVALPLPGGLRGRGLRHLRRVQPVPVVRQRHVVQRRRGHDLRVLLRLGLCLRLCVRLCLGLCLRLCLRRRGEVLLHGVVSVCGRRCRSRGLVLRVEQAWDVHDELGVAGQNDEAELS